MEQEDIVERLDRKISDIAEAGYLNSEFHGKRHSIFPVAIDPLEGRAIQRWLKAEHASSVIEIGLGYGFATLNALAALLRLDNESATYFAIDPNQEKRFSNIGLNFLYEFFDPKRIEFSQKPSELSLPQLVDRNMFFDFAIVDGNHRFDAVFIDLFFLEKLLLPGCAIFLDDYQLPAIRKAIAFFCKNLEWKIEEVSEYSENHQWVVVRTRAERLNRAFDFFVDF